MTRTDLRVFIGCFRTMYYACRTDYPCEGCEMGRVASVRSAYRWARRMSSPTSENTE